MFILSTDIDLRSAIAEATTIARREIVDVLGLKPDQAKILARHVLADLTIRKADYIPNRNELKRWKSTVATQEDRRLATVNKELAELRTRAPSFLSEVQKTWALLRDALAVGQVQGFVRHPDNGRPLPIAREWCMRDDAEDAWITGYLRLPFGMVVLDAPVFFTKADLETFLLPLSTKPLPGAGQNSSDGTLDVENGKGSGNGTQEIPPKQQAAVIVAAKGMWPDGYLPNLSWEEIRRKINETKGGNPVSLKTVTRALKGWPFRSV